MRSSVIRSCSGLQHALDEGVLAAADQRGVKFRLGLERGQQIALGERRLQFGQGIADPANHGGIVQARAFAPGESFQNGPRRVKLLGFLEADGADHRAAMRNRGDEAVGLQQPQRLADRRPADAGHLAQLAFDQALARLEGAGHDRLAQFLRDHRPDGRNVLDPKRRLQFSCVYPLLYRLGTGLGSIAIYGQNHHLGNLNMGWLVQREDDRPGNVGRIQRHLELVEIVLFLLPVAAIAGDNDVGPGQAGLHLGDADRGLRQFAPHRFGEHVDARLAGAVGGHIGHDPHRVDRADVDDVAGVAPDHVGHQAAGDPHQADQIGLNDRRPVIRRAGIEPRPAADVVAGIVDRGCRPA